ncbi:MAG: 4-phosphoerythronate dehydrogenase [Kiritimatiellia bacterium]
MDALTTMNILYDRNMLLGKTLFSRLGDARPCDGRTLTPADLKGVDLLFVRSTCRLNRELLSGSDVRFVGSGVAGTDHIDFAALREMGIPVVSAPGCNAESVANYFVSALLALGERQNRDWKGVTLGIVGVGNVGKKVWKFAEEVLGMTVLGCDPPRKARADDRAAETFLPFEALLPQCDVLTFHTPLDASTRGLFSGKIVRETKPGAVLFNLARGPIVENELVATMLEAGLLSDAVIDCWEGEPDYSANLAQLAAITTPHIAGHSFEGRANGTVAVYRAACEFLAVAPGRTPAYAKAPVPELTIRCRGKSDTTIVRAVTKAVCDTEADSARFRAMYSEDPLQRRAAFDAQRKTYPLRRQFSATQVTLVNPSKTLPAKLMALGFRLAK